ncbi:S41 family peptidase [Tissierella sp. MB52-C2]|uniref:S41 family peptidase n=1 Tax=Tissierella sp. MB52-C2 TaxID=3070999 RepID=UPI00280AB4E8|nr:S41 family peptidase [Tissierella sp. MB52-C2]WMM23845.1 S41 family peptidase [Tissierella sp. MB52-C2]
MDEDGNIIYSLGTLSNKDNFSIPMTLLLESGRLTLEKKISLFEYIPLYKENNSSYQYYEVDNIPILQVNSLCRTTASDNTIESFIENSKTLKEKDTVIIDLRGNIGGNMLNVEKWYEGFTGTKLRKDIIESGLYTNTSIDLSKDKFESKENEPDNIKDDCLETISRYENKRYFPGWSPIEYVDFKPIDNKTNIFILMDKKTSSAAEFLIYYLKKLNNVTLIGTNSNGCMLTGNCNSAVLPYSNIRISISHKIYINRDFHNIDGLGILPDLWVKPGQSLNKVINHIKKVS